MLHSFDPRRAASRALALALAVALTLLLAACGGGGKHKAGPAIPSTTVPKVLAVKTSVLKFGSVDIESAGPNNPIDPTTGRAVLNATQAYLDDAVFSPLKTGRLGVSYPGLFDAGVKPQAIGADRAALTDLSIGKVGGLRTNAAAVHLSALEGPLGDLMYVATVFDLQVTGTIAGGRVVIKRHTELTFAKTGPVWYVTAYRVRVVRSTTAGTTTTTATRGTKP